MNPAMTFAVIGGDARQAHLAELLAADGHTVRAYALEDHPLSAAAHACNFQELTHPLDCVLLPVPLAGKDGALNAPLSPESHPLDELMRLFPPGQTVVAGKISHAVFEAAGRRGVRLYDYLEREEFSVLNAIPTAEGALALAMRELPVTLHGTAALVIGYGRIGKILAQDLRALGAKVTVSARSFRDFAWLEAAGFSTLHTERLDGHLSGFSLIFNTVPHRILGAAQLRQLPQDCLCIDLASRPGGIDHAAAQELGVRSVLELSIPGKFAPVTAAQIQKQTVYHILEEWG